MKLFRYIIIVSVFFSFINSFSQYNSGKGKEFWFGYMEHNNTCYYQNCPLSVVLSSKVSTSGVIEVPLIGFSQSFSLLPDSSVEILLPYSVLNIGHDSLQNKGVHVLAQDSIFVNILNHHQGGGKDDATSILPVEMLGNDYIVTSYTERMYYSGQNQNQTPGSEFLIVAIEDSTLIEIIPSDTLSSGVTSPYIIILNKGETYQGQSCIDPVGNAQSYGFDLTGTQIKVLCNGNSIKKKIAVFSGSRHMHIGNNCSSSSHLVEQLYDVNYWGKEFVVPSLKRREEYFLKIVTSEVNTNVTILNSLGTQTINLSNRGDYNMLSLIGDSYVSSDKPISVFMFIKGNGHNCFQNNSIGYGKPFMIRVPPADNLVREFNFNNSASPPALNTYHTNYLNLLTKTSNITNVFLDGINIASSQFVQFPYLVNYSIAKIELPDSSYSHSLVSYGGIMALVYGLDVNKSNGYSSVAIPYNVAPTFYITNNGNKKVYTDYNDTICSCDTLIFETDYFRDNVIFEWDFGDGTIKHGDSVTKNFFNGDYNVILTIKDFNGCIIEDTLIKNNIVINNCNISTNPLNEICEGDSILITASNGLTYLWNTGETTQSILVSPIVTSIYSVSVDGNQKTFCDSIKIYVNPNPVFSINDTTVCENNLPITIGVNNNLNYSYLWNTNDTNSTISINTAGRYMLNVYSEKLCKFSDTINVDIDTMLNAFIVGQTDACIGDTIRLSSVSVDINNKNPLHNQN